MLIPTQVTHTDAYKPTYPVPLALPGLSDEVMPLPGEQEAGVSDDPQVPAFCCLAPQWPESGWHEGEASSCVSAAHSTVTSLLGALPLGVPHCICSKSRKRPTPHSPVSPKQWFLHLRSNPGALAREGSLAWPWSSSLPPHLI